MILPFGQNLEEADLQTERFRLKFSRKDKFWLDASFGWILNGTPSHLLFSIKLVYLNYLRTSTYTKREVTRDSIGNSAERSSTSKPTQTIAFSTEFQTDEFRY